MAALRTMEDFIRKRLDVEGCKRLSISKRPDGRFEASVVHRDGTTATVEVGDDPATALWNCLVPFTMRRRLPSGREVVLDGPVKGLTDDLDDLLSDVSGTTADLEDLLG